MTPFSSASAYCSPVDLFVYHDSAQVGDMLRTGGDPRPSVMSMLDSTSGPGSVLARLLRSAAGRIESTCLVGRRYQPDDLAALYASGTIGAEMLIKLNADLAFWQLCQRRQPNAADPRNVPGAMEVTEFLKALKAGDTIFGFAESAQAGLPGVQQANPNMLKTPNVVLKAVRLFPNSYPNNLVDGGGN